MILDATQLFSNEQAITASAASTNSIDFDGTGVGEGETVNLFARVTTTFATLTSLVINVQDSADDSTFATVLSTPAIAAASLVAGYKFNLNALPNKLRRYVRLSYTVAGSDATAGKITAGLAPNVQTA
jgi:hypothetical protein